ncbi:TPA: hypothetical protein JAN03_20250 [Citrobacter freundii]|nr:hypothetical protein [Citrobacter freundii]
MKDNANAALFDFIPFHPNNDNEHTFTPIPRAIARIKKFNGVANDPGICLVYAHLLGWKNSTGDIRPSQQYIADDCVMSVDSVQRKVKALVKMGWITATPIRKPGCKQVSHTVYTVKSPEDILREIPKHTKKVKQNEGDIPPQFSDIPAAVESVGDSDGVYDIPGEAIQSDPANECSDGVNACPVTLNTNEVEIAGLQKQLSEAEEKIVKFDNWLKGRDVEKMIRYAGQYGINRELSQSIRDLVTEHRKQAVNDKVRLEIELESHGIFDHIAEGVY